MRTGTLDERKSTPIVKTHLRPSVVILTLLATRQERLDLLPRGQSLLSTPFGHT
jgi:hypothetical protein